MSTDRLTVTLTGLEVFGRHGVYAPETELGQRFVVDLEITLSHSEASRSDALDATVDYATLADDVAAIVGGPPVALLERLAGMIADRALAEPHAAEVRVTVRLRDGDVAHRLTASAVTLRRSAS
ncbi:MAG: dihydroneopterin aldolase [Thermoleophilia bacterium]|nr:dihydroneopterin aldolase [Thermoleophilia bacterium]